MRRRRASSLRSFFVGRVPLRDWSVTEPPGSREGTQDTGDPAERRLRGNRRRNAATAGHVSAILVREIEKGVRMERSTRRGLWMLVPLLTALALVAAACGGDEEGTEETTGTTGATGATGADA